jgi:hypothetical protein
VDPVVPYTDAAQIASIRDFYGLDAERLPLEAQLITRSQLGVAAPKRLYFLNSGVNPAPASPPLASLSSWWHRELPCALPALRNPLVHPVRFVGVAGCRLVRSESGKVRE